ncbi:MAG: GEVED domain-containing protein [Psychroflexus halocasei]
MEAANDSIANFKVWIDWDKDGDFNFTDEMYDLGTTQPNQTEAKSIDITVPSDNRLGILRMRVHGVSATDAVFDPCTVEKGEFEDYNLNINDRYTSDILAPIVQTQAMTVKPDTVSTIANQFEVFKFNIVDAGLSDSLPTKITQIRLQAGPLNTANWNTHIADVIFNDGTVDLAGVATINNNEIIFDLSSPLEIAHGTNQDIATKIFLKQGGIVDGNVIQFEIPENPQFVVSADNSNGFLDPLPNGKIKGNPINIDVQINQIDFVTQPTDTNVDEVMLPQVEVAGVDNDGNIDTDFNADISVTSTGTMTDEPLQDSISNGVAVLDNIVHTITGTDFYLTASESTSTYPDVDSELFDIINLTADAKIIEPVAGSNSTQTPSSVIIAGETLTANDAKEVFKFRVQDEGFDSADTKITQVKFTAAQTNTVDDWTNYIDGVLITDGNTTFTPTTTNITDSVITLAFSTPIYVTEGTTKDFDAEIYLKSTPTIVEGEKISLEIIANSHGFETDPSGSNFQTTFTKDITGNEHTIDVVATKFIFSEQPSDTHVNVDMSPAVEVYLVDANDNLDSDNNTIVTISSTGTLLGTTVSDNAINGIAQFSNLIHTQSGAGLNLIATNGSFTPVNSDTFDILQPADEIIAIQDFDDTTPEWIITSIDEATNNTWGTQYYSTINVSDMSPLENTEFGENIFGINNYEATTNSNNNIIELASVDISNYTDVTFSIDFAYLNLEDADKFNITLTYNDNNTETFDFLGTSADDNSGTFTFNIDDSKTSVSATIEVLNNNADEYIGIDNIRLESKKVSVDYVYENNAWSPETPDGNSTIEDNIIVKAGSENWPELLSTNFVNSVEIEPTAELTVSSELVIGGDFIVNGNLNSNTNSTYFFVGTALQTFGGDNDLIDIQNLESNSVGGLNLTSNFNLYENLTIGNGDINLVNNKTLTIKSSSAKTATIGRIAEGSKLKGNVLIERFIPKSNRAFRYISSSITTNGSIRDNFQEGVNNTGTNDADNINPNPGYGTHITGSQSGSDGFDATLTGNPSMFVWTAQNTWTGINNTNSSNLIAGKPYSLMVRGDRSTTLNSNDAIGPATTLRMSGQGENLVYGTSSVSQSTLPNVGDSFAFIGNKYQAQVDMKQMVSESTDLQQSVYIYDPSLNSQGGYVTVDLTTPNGTSTPSTAQNKYLQPNQSFFIKTVQSASVSPSIQFKEVYKTNSPQNIRVFSQDEDSVKEILLSLYKEIDEEFVLSDGLRVQFDQNYTAEVNDQDVQKFWNRGENISTHVDGVNYLTIDRRQTADENTEVQLFSHNFETASYEFKINVSNMENAFLYDAYLDETHQLDLGENIINFDVESSNPSSIASDRFKFVFENETFSNPVFGDKVDLSIYPNPNAKEDLKIRSTQLNGEEVNINVYDNFGRMIISKKASFENQVMTLDFTQQLNAGLYHLEISNDNFKTNKKLIIE